MEEVASPNNMLPILAALAALLLTALFFLQKSKASTVASAAPSPAQVQLDPQADAAYLANCLRPTSSPLDILYAIATTPDQVALTSKSLEMAEEVRVKKMAYLNRAENGEAARRRHQSMEDLLDGGSWAEDDDDDPAAVAARKAEEVKEKEASALAKATGKDKTDVTKVKLEGVDDGVLGQEWVLKQLGVLGVWPPPSSDGIGGKQFTTIVGGKKKVVGALDHPAVKRNLIMTMGRLNARQLNTHPELLDAGPKGLIDPTYFQSTMEYRKRASMLLEAALRMACTLRSFRLASAVVDAMVMFKIGLMAVDDTKEVEWFRDLMMKQYGEGGTPKLIVEEKYLGVPTEEPEAVESKDGDDKAAKKEAEKNKIARLINKTKQVTTTDEKMALEMQITRQHAESFTKEKLMQCQKQGIPPQIGMQAYRESWFILVRAKKLDGDVPPTDKAYGSDHLKLMHENKHQLYEMLDSNSIKSFEKEFNASSSSKAENRIVVGWPFVIQNVAQKAGKVKIHLPPPSEAGKYEFSVSIKSQDFLGVDEEFCLVVDVKKGVEDTEAKKEK